MHVYAVALEKGGVGKTSIAVNLAVAFALVDLKVLLIDLDAQCHASQWLGDPRSIRCGLMKACWVLCRDGRSPNASGRPRKTLTVLPAHPAMVGLPAMLLARPTVAFSRSRMR